MKEEEGKEEENELSGVRGSGKGAAKEGQEQETVGAPDEGEESKRKGKENAAAAATAADATAIAEGDTTAIVSEGEGREDGDDLSGPDAPAMSSATPAPSQAGKEAVATHEERESGQEIARGGAKDAQTAERESDGGHDQADDENSGGGQDREGGTASGKGRDAAGAQVPCEFATSVRLLSSACFSFFSPAFACDQSKKPASSKYRGI